MNSPPCRVLVPTTPPCSHSRNLSHASSAADNVHLPRLGIPQRQSLSKSVNDRVPAAHAVMNNRWRAAVDGAAAIPRSAASPPLPPARRLCVSHLRKGSHGLLATVFVAGLGETECRRKLLPVIVILRHDSGSRNSFQSTFPASPRYSGCAFRYFFGLAFLMNRRLIGMSIRESIGIWAFIADAIFKIAAVRSQRVSAIPPRSGPPCPSAASDRL